MLSFEELTEARRSLQSFCRLYHVPSLLAVQSGISFKLVPSETKKLDDGELHHPTTTTTCLSSAFDCPARYRTDEFKRAEDIKAKLTEAAFRRQDWTSDGSAGVYCRCRAFPMIIRSSVSLDQRIDAHLEAILGQLKKQPDRFGIGEAEVSRPEKEWYPPNAFHTYWTLEILRLIEILFNTEYKRLSDTGAFDLGRRRDGMILWARQQLGSQLGLHSGSPPSSMLDSDQLAWALAIFLRFDRALKVNLENRDFTKQALRCLFSTQIDGTWRHYKPLFHYEEAGNAYCYVFETFAALLQCALLEGPEAAMFRDLLKPYGKNLMDLWLYADSTKIPLAQGGKEIGWCSGHRTNVTEPESWATASVFSYAQALRQLTGIWCREEALFSRQTSRTRDTEKRAATKIAEQGQTWGKGAPVSEQLWTLFVNPVRKQGPGDILEPDSQPIEEHQARSAILFGPPGTGKTTLVRAMADVVKWEYVEIHASHFVADGLPNVQKTADKIFRQLSELDRTVVLFDEIDELVREREMEKDAFGRFLTTSMLPKLAELWEARKIIYFVATNHINYFDSAIIRSHRFDALILVSPPAFASKIRELTDLLSQVYGHVRLEFEIQEEIVEKELEKLVNSRPALGAADTEEKRWLEQILEPDSALAKFALLRWDELKELAYRLDLLLKGQSPSRTVIPNGVLKQALQLVADSQWRKNRSYVDYMRDRLSERRDYQMLRIWEVLAESINRSSSTAVTRNGGTWLAGAADSLKDFAIEGCELVPEPPGSVKILLAKSAPPAEEPSRS
jgi:hypothetical protein